MKRKRRSYNKSNSYSYNFSNSRKDWCPGATHQLLPMNRTRSPKSILSEKAPAIAPFEHSLALGLLSPIWVA
jgi:hypothetical protein